MQAGILSKITVIDMTEGVAGPYATMVLSDMGANVIKVERPAGDWSRVLPPNFVGGPPITPKLMGRATPNSSPSTATSAISVWTLPAPKAGKSWSG